MLKCIKGKPIVSMDPQLRADRKMENVSSASGSNWSSEFFLFSLGAVCFGAERVRYRPEMVGKSEVMRFLVVDTDCANNRVAYSEPEVGVDALRWRGRDRELRDEARGESERWSVVGPSRDRRVTDVIEGPCMSRDPIDGLNGTQSQQPTNENVFKFLSLANGTILSGPSFFVM